MSVEETLHERRTRLRYEIALLERQSRDINRMRAQRKLLTISKDARNLTESLAWSRSDTAIYHQGSIISNGWSWEGSYRDEHLFVICSFRVNKVEDRGWEWGITAWDRVIEEEVEEGEIFFRESREPLLNIWEKNPSHRLPWFFWTRRRKRAMERLCAQIAREFTR